MACFKCWEVDTPHGYYDIVICRDVDSAVSSVEEELEWACEHACPRAETASDTMCLGCQGLYQDMDDIRRQLKRMKVGDSFTEFSGVKVLVRCTLWTRKQLEEITEL